MEKKYCKNERLGEQESNLVKIKAKKVLLFSFFLICQILPSDLIQLFSAPSGLLVIVDLVYKSSKA